MEFNWSLSEEEAEPLIKDNAGEEEDPYSDIPVEMLGVVMEYNDPTIQTPTKDAGVKENRARE